MLFNSIDFLLFLPTVIILYYLIPAKYRWIMLLGASYAFYMSWKVEYVLLIIASTLVDYFAALQMEKRESKRSRLPFLILSLCANLGLLFTFQYFNFFTSNVNVLLGDALPTVELLLPVGISFYTFQTLSYSIDVYNKKQSAERHLGYFALYVSYFPQLVAGPIERYSRLAPQLKKEHKFEYSNLSNGFRLILFGLFVKMVIADNLAPFVDAAYSNPDHYNSIDIGMAMVMYAFQIYGDFFGYSTVAIGAAMMMGVKLMDNFKTPYLARNIGEFWQRWHISLSTWFRDYLYLPMGGNRVRVVKWTINILVVFVVSGVWHGANWTFVFWGALYGVLYLIEKGLNKVFSLEEKKNKYSALHVLLSIKTFVFVTLIWVFFRSQNLDQAWEMFGALFTNGWTGEESLTVSFALTLILIAFLIIDMLLYNTRFDTWIGEKHLSVRWSVYSILIFCIIVFAGVEHYPFIYFQF
jgi:D-alanyl-lipoteichoic acid acyltransferase DltB (MBOAT superfamily)